MWPAWTHKSVRSDKFFKLPIGKFLYSKIRFKNSRINCPILGYQAVMDIDSNLLSINIWEHGTFYSDSASYYDMIGHAREKTAIKLNNLHPNNNSE